jgi:hypothetical protein
MPAAIAALLRACVLPLACRPAGKPNFSQLSGQSLSGEGEVARHILTDAKTYQMTGQTGAFVYMAPEVLLTKPYNEKVDVFRCGGGGGALAVAEQQPGKKAGQRHRRRTPPLGRVPASQPATLARRACMLRLTPADQRAALSFPSFFPGGPALLPAALASSCTSCSTAR